MTNQYLSSIEPWIFNIELTNRCPFSCIMCARTNNMSRVEGDMSMELFQSILEQLDINSPAHYKNRLLRLHHFGESLVHPQVIEMVKLATNKGFKTALSINPLQLTSKISKGLLESGINTLFISLDGHDNKTFEEIRGVKNAYDKSVVRLERFLKMKDEISSNIHIELSMIDFNNNKKSITTKKQNWSSKTEIDEFRLKQFIDWDGSADDINALKDLETDEQLQEFSESLGACFEPFKRMTVLFDGRVVPCCYDYNGKYILGDLTTHSIKEIWNNEPIIALRKQFKEKSVTNELCKNCHQSPGNIAAVNIFS